MREKILKMREEERKQLENFLKERFGVKIPKDWILFKKVGKGFYFWPVSVFCGNENLIEKLEVFEIGIPFGTLEAGEFKFSLEISDFVENQISKNVIELTDEEVEKLFNGENIQKKLKLGSYVLKFKGRMVGGAFCDGRKILNFLPRVFEFELKPKRKVKKEREKPIRIEKLGNFIRFFSDLPDFDIQKFLETVHDRTQRFAIRVNPLKTNLEKFFENFKEVKFTPVPWCKGCYFVEEKDKWITKSLNYILGDFYLQEPASLIAVLALDPKPGEKVLDLCAAPGSKTTQICQSMRLKGTIVANEPNIERAKILVANLRRWGAMNTIVTCYDGRKFLLRETFDKVLVDAPCTGIGNDLKSVYKWKKETTERLSQLQKQLIVSGFEALKKGGILVYSTCTISKEENEKVIEFLLKKYKGKAIAEEIQLEGIKFTPGMVKNTIRIYPYQNLTESFFVAKIKKLI
jgi:NOL1/NOP2/sun family putative RNA methylase